MWSPVIPGTLLGVSALLCILLLIFRTLPPLEDEAGRVTNPFPLCVVGFVSLGAATLTGVVLLTTAMDPEGVLLQGLLTLSGLMLVQGGCFPCIRYGKSGFTVRTFFGRSHFCRWEDIRCIRAGKQDDLWLVTREKRFFLDGMAEGRSAFLRYAARHVPERTLPILPKKPPFGLPRPLPAGLLGSACLITTLMLLLLCIAGWMLRHPQEEHTLEAASIAFDGIDRALFGKYTLVCGETRFTVRPDRSERAALESAVEAGAAFHILFRKGGSSGNAKAQIWRMQDEAGHVYLSFARALERDRNLCWWLTGIFAAVPVGGWLYVAYVVHAARQAGPDGPQPLPRPRKSNSRR